MWILLGYMKNIISARHTPDIRIFGIYNEKDEIFTRIKCIDENKFIHRNIVGQTNVVETQLYIFWYKEINDLANFNISASNSP